MFRGQNICWLLLPLSDGHDPGEPGLWTLNNIWARYLNSMSTESCNTPTVTYPGKHDGGKGQVTYVSLENKIRVTPSACAVQNCWF